MASVFFAWIRCLVAQTLHALDASSPVVPVVALARRCHSIVITQGCSANLSIECAARTLSMRSGPPEPISGSRSPAFVHFARNLCADASYVCLCFLLPVFGSDGDPISLALDKPGRPSACQWSFDMMVLDGG